MVESFEQTIMNPLLRPCPGLRGIPIVSDLLGRRIERPGGVGTPAVSMARGRLSSMSSRVDSSRSCRVRIDVIASPIEVRVDPAAASLSSGDIVGRRGSLDGFAPLAMTAEHRPLV